MSYKNPIPSLDDKEVSKDFWIGFAFKEYLTKDEALEGINNVLKELMPIESNIIHMGYPRCMRMAEKQPPKEYYSIVGYNKELENVYIDPILYCNYSDAFVVFEKLRSEQPYIINARIVKQSVNEQFIRR